MQYAKMIDLLKDAELAGERETEFVNERLADAFDLWLDEQHLGEITEEEEEALRKAFEKGFGLCFHSSS
jgi:predicted DNA binding protein